MIISKKHKTIFFRVPKTGSTTLESSIRFSGVLGEKDIMSGVLDCGLLPKNLPTQCVADIEKNRESLRNGGKALKHIDIVHTTPDDLFNGVVSEYKFVTQKQLTKYKAYAVIRNPLSRIISAYLFTIPRKIPVSPETFQTYMKSVDLSSYIVYKKQIEYFNLDGEKFTTPILFEDYSNEISRVISDLGGNPLGEYPIFKKMSRPMLKPNIDEWIKSDLETYDMLLEYYHEDIELWEKTSGKTI